MYQLTQQRLKELLTYDPETGVFRMCPRADRGERWNQKHVGTVPGYIIPRRGTDGGYERISVDGCAYYGHQLAWLYMTGELPPKGMEVDHRNRVRADNRWKNLRLATKGQNGHNRDVQSNNTSGVKGVSWDKDRQKWFASITVGSRTQALGRFDNKDQAIAAREAAEARLHGEFAVVKGAA